MYLVIILLAFGAVSLFFFQLLSSNKGQELKREAGMEELRQWSDETKLVKSLEPFVKLLSPLTDLMTLPKPVVDKYKRLILSAGFDLYVRVNDIFGLQFVLAIGLALMSRVWFSDDFFLLIIMAVVGFFVPVLWLSQSATERRQQILRELPPVVDMVGLSVGAGLEFDAAIERVVRNAHRDKSPLIYELRVYLRNIFLNMPRDEALKEFAYRVNGPEVQSFTSILIQADKMGSDISATLVQQAARLREERFVAAEKAGAVAAQKIMLPMMLFIFPLIFAIIILPLVLNYIFN